MQRIYELPHDKTDICSLITDFELKVQAFCLLKEICEMRSISAHFKQKFEDLKMEFACSILLSRVRDISMDVEIGFETHKSAWKEVFNFLMDGLK